MGIRKRLKDFKDWCPQPPSRLPVKLSSYSMPIAAVLLAAVIFGVFLSLPSLQNVPTQLAPQLPQTMSENSTQPSPTHTPTPTPTQASTSTTTPTPMPSPPTVTQVTAVNGNLELTMSVVKTVFSVGEAVNVSFAIINIGNQTFDFTRTTMNFDLAVSNGTNNVVYDYFATQIFSMIAWDVPISPGGNITETIVWPQTYVTNPMYVPGPQVVPGTYYILGKSNSLINNSLRNELQTDPLEIVIVGS